MSNQVFDSALTEFARLFAAVEAETSRLAGEHMRIDALRTQSRELSVANREVADQLAAARREVADAALKVDAAHRHAAEILASAECSAAERIADAEAQTAPHRAVLEKFSQIMAAMK